MWKAKDTDELRESLTGFGKPFAITAFAFACLSLWETPPLHFIGAFFLVGLIWSGVLVAAWRRRIPVHLGLTMMLLLVPFHLLKEQGVAGDSGATTCLFLAASVVYGVLFFARATIIQYARLEPALEL